MTYLGLDWYKIADSVVTPWYNRVDDGLNKIQSAVGLTSRPDPVRDAQIKADQAKIDAALRLQQQQWSAADFLSDQNKGVLIIGAVVIGAVILGRRMKAKRK